MAKKKVKRISKPQTKRSVSISDAESECDNSPKRFKTELNCNIELSSTPYSKPSTSSSSDFIYTYIENEMSFDASQLEDDGDSFANFTSFLKSYSLDSEDEEKLPTVSRLVKNRRDTSMYRISNIPKNEPVESTNSFLNLSDDAEEAIRVISVASKHLEIVLLQHPASLTLHGYIKVIALVGTVSILGYDLKEENSVHVLSSKNTGFKKLTTQKSVHKSTKARYHKKLLKIMDVQDKDDLPDFLDLIGPGTVVVILQKSLLPPPLEFLELYCPRALEINWGKKEKTSLCSTEESNVITINSDAELIAKQVNELICESFSGHANFGTCVMVHGPKQSGKSSLLRYLINTVLNTYPEVYYLDTDPGQTEFTPPGTVSLVKVTHPLFGPPFSHRRKPVKMVFTGSVTAATSPPMYLKSVQDLIEHFNSNFPKETLFVNTMGWVKGIGEVCFQSIKKAVKPTVLIDFLPPEECPELKVEELSNKTVSIEVPAKEYSSSPSFAPKDIRNFALLSYFGKCQKYYMQPTYLNAFRPACVSWDNVAIFVMGKKVPPNRLIEAIHCSVVALCHVDESFMLESDKPEFPRTLVDEPPNDCIGFGIVRAADEASHLLYIVTPLSLEELVKVNTLIKGNVVIPDEVFLKQPILNVPLPYTDQSKAAPTFHRKVVKKRSFRKSITQTPG